MFNRSFPQFKQGLIAITLLFIEFDRFLQTPETHNNSALVPITRRKLTIFLLEYEKETFVSFRRCQ